MKKIALSTFAAATLAIASPLLAADVSHGDKAFLKNAAQAGHTEVEGSQLAQQRSSAADVKSFADQMIKDHTAAGDELTKLASSKGVEVPTDPSLMQKGQIKMLSASSADNFDKRYADKIGVADHEATVKLFRKASTDAKDPDIKAWAAKTLPTLEHHLEMAKMLKAAHDKKG